MRFGVAKTSHGGSTVARPAQRWAGHSAHVAAVRMAIRRDHASSKSDASRWPRGVHVQRSLLRDEQARSRPVRIAAAPVREPRVEEKRSNTIEVDGSQVTVHCCMRRDGSAMCGAFGNRPPKAWPLGHVFVLTTGKTHLISCARCRRLAMGTVEPGRWV